jgi:hypothetical protein
MYVSNLSAALRIFFVFLVADIFIDVEIQYLLGKTIESISRKF